MSGDVLVPVALEAASEEGSPMMSPSPSGSLHCAEASSPSGSVRQHGESAPHCIKTPSCDDGTNAQYGKRCKYLAEQCMPRIKLHMYVSWQY